MTYSTEEKTHKTFIVLREGTLIIYGDGVYTLFSRNFPSPSSAEMSGGHDELR